MHSQIMTSRPRRTISLRLMFAIICLGSGIATAEERPELPPHEFYIYETVAMNDPAARPQEHVEMQIRYTSNKVHSVYKSKRPDGSQVVTIQMTRDGLVISASMVSYDRHDKVTTSARIWVADNRVHVHRIKRNHRHVEKSKPIGDKRLLADASILLVLRSFPFARSEEVEYLMASFDPYFITMRFQQKGVETITVPAGTFECYRLEGYVDLIIKKLKMTYWLSREKPHFLVKYEGKRGIFLAPTYQTSLKKLGPEND